MIIFGDYFLLAVWYYLFSIIYHCVIVGGDIFFEAVEEACFPDIDNLIRSSRNEVISISTKLSRIGMRLKSVL